MDTAKHINWATVHTVAKSVVNNSRKRYLLSNAEADDCVSDLTVRYVHYASTHKLGAMSIKTRLSRAMTMRLPRLVEALRGGGLTGEVENVSMHDYHGPAPTQRAPGDVTWPVDNGPPPLLCDVLPAPDKAGQQEAEMTVAQLMVSLPDDRRELIVAYYGLDGQDPQSLEELAQAYKVSAHTVWIRLRKIEDELKKVSKSGSINSDREELNAAVRAVRHAEPKPSKDAGLLRVRTRNPISRLWRADGSRARSGAARRERRPDATGTGSQ